MKVLIGRFMESEKMGIIAYLIFTLSQSSQLVFKHLKKR